MALDGPWRALPRARAHLVAHEAQGRRRWEPRERRGLGRGDWSGAGHEDAAGDEERAKIRADELGAGRKDRGSVRSHGASWVEGREKGGRRPWRRRRPPGAALRPARGLPGRACSPRPRDRAKSRVRDGRDASRAPEGRRSRAVRGANELPKASKSRENSQREGDSKSGAQGDGDVAAVVAVVRAAGEGARRGPRAVAAPGLSLPGPPTGAPRAVKPDGYDGLLANAAYARANVSMRLQVVMVVRSVVSI